MLSEVNQPRHVEQLPDKSIFMMCRALNRAALTDLPAGFSIRNCRPEELDFWKALPFDDPALAAQYHGFMTEFFDRVYGPRESDFFAACKFICDAADRPLGTGFVWRIPGNINTFHWLKVLPQQEGRGLGRALLSAILRDLPETEYPIFLHTQPESFRAIKLYSDFGFDLLTDPVIGTRKNDLEECRPMLKRVMLGDAYASLRTATAPAWFLEALKSETEPHF